MPGTVKSVGLKRRNIVPALSRFAFGFDCPPDWNQLELPTETPDFDGDPKVFFPLAVFMSPQGPLIFSVGARPVYSDGTVYDWAKFLLEAHGLAFTQLMPEKVNGFPAVRGLATQPSEDGPMQVAVAFMEDGASLLQLSAMAPQTQWPALEAMMLAMIDSFALHRPQGATVPLVPGQEKPMNEATFRAMALSDEATTLTDPDIKLNAYMRDNGIGLLPRAMSIDEEQRFAMMGCGSIMAAVPVPFGWHIIDDGKRALLFTADNAIQINFSLIQTGDMTIDQGMDQIIAGMLKEQPQVEHHKLDLQGTPTLAFKGLNIGGETLNQVFMFTRDEGKGFIMQTRVTSSEADQYRAMDLAGLILEKMQVFQ